MSEKKSLSQSTLILMTANTITLVLVFLYRVALSRMIGAQGMGLYALIMPVYTIASTILSSGIPVAVMKLTSEQTALKNYAGVKKVVRFAVLLMMAVSVILAVGVFFFARELSVWLGDPNSRIPLMALSAVIITTGFENIYKNFFYGLNKVYEPSVIEVIEQISRMSTILLLLYWLRPEAIVTAVLIIVIGMVVGEVVSGLGLWIFYKRETKGYKNSIDTGLRLPRDVMQTALPITFTRLSANIIGSVNAVIIPRLLVAYGYTYDSALATFGVMTGMAMPLLSLPLTLINALSILLIPKLSANLVLSRDKDTQRKISQSIFFTSAAVFPCVAVFLALSQPLGVVLFGQELVGHYLLIMSGGILFQCYYTIFASVLNGLGREKSAAVHAIAGSLIQLLCTWILVPRIGVYGFIAGFLLSSLVDCMTSFIEIKRHARLPFTPLQWVGKPLLAAALMYNAALLVYRVMMRGFSMQISLLAALIAGVAAYLAVLFLQGVFKRDKGKNGAEKSRFSQI